MHACLRLAAPQELAPQELMPQELVPQELAPHWRELLAQVETTLAVVVAGRESRLGALQGLLPPPQLAGRDLMVPGRVLYRNPHEMGLDRRVCAFAARACYGPALVLDCGTALTLTHVDTDWAVRGLAIAAGYRCLQNAFDPIAPALAPLTGGTAPIDAIPDGTAQCLAVGRDAGWCGLVAALVEDARRRLGAAGLDSSQIVVTGSDATRALVAVQGGRHAPSLVHEGLWRLAYGPG